MRNNVVALPDLPASVGRQLDQLASLLQEHLGDGLLGLILHGSAATSGFEEDRSDIDVLAIAARPLTADQCGALGPELLAITKSPHILEMSIVPQSALDNWKHPCPYELHLGDRLITRYAEDSIHGTTLRDEDLAMHFTIARARGVDLLGNYPIDQLPVIPETDFLKAILIDFEWADSSQEELDAYMHANACRTLAYLESGLILSKQEGLTWCAEQGVETNGILPIVLLRVHSRLEEIAQRPGSEPNT